MAHYKQLLCTWKQRLGSLENDEGIVPTLQDHLVEIEVAAFRDWKKLYLLSSSETLLHISMMLHYTLSDYSTIIEENQYVQSEPSKWKKI
ncbi:hypothetical protein Dimus_005416 [Dionaea muscipula]